MGRLLIIPSPLHILRFWEELESVKQEVTPRRLVPYIVLQVPLRKYMVPISLCEQEHVHFSTPLIFRQMTIGGAQSVVLAEREIVEIVNLKIREFISILHKDNKVPKT